MTKVRVRARALDAFSKTILDLGGDPKSVFRAARLSPSAVDDPDSWVPFDRVLRAYERASRETGCPYFGMYLATNRSLSYLGPLFLMIKYSENLRSGLESFAKYSSFQNSGYRVTLDEIGHSVEFRFHLSPELRSNAAQWIEESLATTLKALRVILGPSYSPPGLTLAHQPVGQPGDYRRHMGIAPQFGAAHDAVILDADSLTTANPREDHDMVRFLHDYLHARVPSADEDIVATVKALLTELVPTGNCSIDIVAEQLSIHPRTLQRRLADAGVRFADLLDTCRATMATEFLKDGDQRIVNIAHMLGYSDQSAFNHAFRRWHGTSPRMWTEKNKAIGK